MAGSYENVGSGDFGIVSHSGGRPDNRQVIAGTPHNYVRSSGISSLISGNNNLPYIGCTPINNCWPGGPRIASSSSPQIGGSFTSNCGLGSGGMAIGSPVDVNISGSLENQLRSTGRFSFCTSSENHSGSSGLRIGSLLDANISGMSENQFGSTGSLNFGLFPVGTQNGNGNYRGGISGNPLGLGGIPKESSVIVGQDSNHIHLPCASKNQLRWTGFRNSSSAPGLQNNNEPYMLGNYRGGISGIPLGSDGISKESSVVFGQDNNHIQLPSDSKNQLGWTGFRNSSSIPSLQNNNEPYMLSNYRGGNSGNPLGLGGISKELASVVGQDNNQMYLPGASKNQLGWTGFRTSSSTPGLQNNNEPNMLGTFTTNQQNNNGQQQYGSSGYSLPSFMQQRSGPYIGTMSGIHEGSGSIQIGSSPTAPQRTQPCMGATMVNQHRLGQIGSSLGKRGRRNMTTGSSSRNQSKKHRSAKNTKYRLPEPEGWTEEEAEIMDQAIIKYAYLPSNLFYIFIAYHLRKKSSLDVVLRSNWLMSGNDKGRNVEHILRRVSRKENVMDTAVPLLLQNENTSKTVSSTLPADKIDHNIGFLHQTPDNIVTLTNNYDLDMGTHVPPLPRGIYENQTKYLPIPDMDMIPDELMNIDFAKFLPPSPARGLFMTWLPFHPIHSSTKL